MRSTATGSGAATLPQISVGSPGGIGRRAPGRRARSSRDGGGMPGRTVPVLPRPGKAVLAVHGRAPLPPRLRMTSSCPWIDWRIVSQPPINTVVALLSGLTPLSSPRRAHNVGAGPPDRQLSVHDPLGSPRRMKIKQLQIYFLRSKSPLPPKASFQHRHCTVAYGQRPYDVITAGRGHWTAGECKAASQEVFGGAEAVRVSQEVLTGSPHPPEGAQTAES